MNLLGGGFTCVFTDRDWRRDEPPVFKFAADVLEAACYALPAREPGDPRGQEEYETLEYECLDHIRAAVLAEPVAGLLRAVRETRAFDCVVCDFDRAERRLAVHGRVPPKASPPTDAPVEPDPAGGANRPARSAPWSVTPGRYGDPETSDLSLTLSDASQTFDIDLRP